MVKRMNKKEEEEETCGVVITSECCKLDAVVSVDKPRVGDMVACRECDTKLEIISTDPFEVDFPIDYYDDWDDDWDDDGHLS